MRDFLLSLLPILFVFVAIYKCKGVEEKEIKQSWGLEQGKMLQAIACIGVVIHHLAQQVTNYGTNPRGLLTFFDGIGILFTAIFFFYSGYGLLTSYLSKNNYLDNFLWHRLSTVFVPFCVTNLIYILYRIYICRLPMDTRTFLGCLFGVRLINDHSWYIVEIIILYLIFYCIFRVITKKDIAILLNFIVIICIIWYSALRGHESGQVYARWFYGEWWYNTTLIFGVGMLVARFKNRILNLLEKHCRKFLIGICVAVVIIYFLEEFIRMRFGYYNQTPVINGVNNVFITLLAQIILCLIFLCGILLINIKIHFHNPVLKGISKISLELYLIHGLYIDLFFSLKIFEPMSCVLVIGCSILTAIFLHHIDKILLKVCNFLHEWCKEKLKWYGKKFSRKAHETKKGILTSLFFGAVVIVLLIAVTTIREQIEVRAELLVLNDAKAGDIVLFGRYDTDSLRFGKERVEWIVLQKNKNEIMLLAKEGLVGSTYHRQHKQVTWEESDLCDYLNHTLCSKILSGKREGFLMPNPETGEKMSLLSIDEARTFFTDDESRQLSITDVAEKTGTNINILSKVNDWDMKEYRSSWWWLRAEKRDIYAPIVTVDGEIQLQDKNVNWPNGAVRPVVWIKTNPIK